MRILINALDKFSGVVGSLFIFWSLGKYVFDNFDKVPRALLIVIFVIAVLFLVIFVRQVRKTIRALRIRKIDSDIKKKLTNTGREREFSPNDILTTKQIKNWLEVADYQAKEWAHDAVRQNHYTGYSIRYYSTLGLSHNYSAGYYSKSKVEFLSISMGGYQHFSEARPDYEILEGEVPFYQNQPNWRKGMIAVYKHVEDKLDKQFNMFICNIGERGAGLVSISCEYTRGKREVETGVSFTFDGKYIFNDSLKIKVE